MKRTPLLLTLAVIIMIAGGYFLYEKVFNVDPTKPWDLVPSGSVLVYEKDICDTCIEELQKSAPWQIIEKASLHTKPADSITSRLRAVINNGKGLLISAHITRKDDFDFIYYLSGLKNLQSSISSFSKLRGYRYSEREFNNVKIHELTANKQTFSWVVIGDVWAGSFTPFLIEDVIRTYNGKADFAAANPEVSKLPRIKGDAGNIYIHLKAFADLFAIFVPGNEKSYSVGKTSLLDIK